LGAHRDSGRGALIVKPKRPTSAPLRIVLPTKPSLAPERDPRTAFETLRDVCLGSGELPPSLASWIARSLDTWLAGDKTLEEAFGVKARRGDRFDTPHERSRRARRDEALFVAVAQFKGSAWQKAGALQRVLAGEASPPNPGARAALEGLAAQGIALPRSQRGLYAVIADLVKAHPDLTSDRDE
jgi:hypothetical protein